MAVCCLAWSDSEIHCQWDYWHLTSTMSSPATTYTLLVAGCFATAPEDTCGELYT
jgi:hypothetical protein